MPDSHQSCEAGEIAFEAYGVRLAVSTSEPGLIEQVRPLLPPGWRPCPTAAAEHRFVLRAIDVGTYVVTKGDEAPAPHDGVGLDRALTRLDSQIRLYLSRTAPDTVFTHAGAVAHNGKAIVIPGHSLRGKTSLVAALVRAGAVYYSDEFAPIDKEGLVHPYAKALSLREDPQNQSARTDRAVESFGGVVGNEAVPLGMIVVTKYRAGAEWRPRRASAGAGALALLENTVPAQERPEEVTRALSRAATDAIVIEGDRGEADDVAPLLLAELAAG